MLRPPAEIRRMEEEERRRARAHRRLAWERRLRTGLWILGAMLLLGGLVLVFRLLGVSGG